MQTFLPKLSCLPPSQQTLARDLSQTPSVFTLYGGTALALRLGHRTSVDFDFFSTDPFDPDSLACSIPYLRNAERIQVEPNTLTCRVDRDGPVLVSFFGSLRIGQIAPSEEATGLAIQVASLLDIAGAKAAVIQKRAEAKDYIDIAALLAHGLELSTILAAGKILYGNSFNPLITLKALSYFDDVPGLPVATQTQLVDAVSKTDPARLPALDAHRPCRLN